MISNIPITPKTAVLVALCLIVPTVILTILIAPQVSENSQNINSAQIKVEQAKETTKAIIAAFEKSCEQDHEFRIQYKVRGRAEKKLLALFLVIARKNIERGHGNQTLNENFIKEFKPLLDRIHIIPPPDCEKQNQELRDTLNGVEKSNGPAR